MSSFGPGDEVIVTLDRDQGHIPRQALFVAGEAPNSVGIVAAEACPERDAIELRACHGEGISRVNFVSVATSGLEARQLPALPGTVVLISPNLKDVLRIYYQDQGHTSDLSAVTARSAATARSTPQPNGAAPAATSSSARASPTSLTPEASGLHELARNMMRELQDMKAEMTRMQARTLAAHSASRSPDRWTAERPPWSAPPGRTTWNDVLGTRTGGIGNENARRRRTWIQDEGYDEEDAVNLEMLKTLRPMRKRRGIPGSSGSDHSGSDTDSFDGNRTKSFGGIHNMQRLLKRKPNRFTQRSVERMKDKLGVRSTGQYWRLCLSISRAISEQNGDDDQAPPKGGGGGKGKRKTKATTNGAANATGAVDPA